MAGKHLKLVTAKLENLRKDASFWKYGDPRRILSIVVLIKNFGNVSCADSTLDLRFEQWFRWQISEESYDSYIECLQQGTLWRPVIVSVNTSQTLLSWLTCHETVEK